MPPGASIQSYISASFTIAGTVASFDAKGFKKSLASMLSSSGVTEADIELTVTAASINVAAKILATSAATAAAAVTTLTAADASTLSSQLGVTVESVGEIGTYTAPRLASPPPAPLGVPVPSTPPELASSAGMSTGVLVAILGGVGGGLVVLSLVSLRIWCKPPRARMDPSMKFSGPVDSSTEMTEPRTLQAPTAGKGYWKWVPSAEYGNPFSSRTPGRNGNSRPPKLPIPPDLPSAGDLEPLQANEIAV